MRASFLALVMVLAFVGLAGTALADPDAPVTTSSGCNGVAGCTTILLILPSAGHWCVDVYPVTVPPMTPPAEIREC